MSAFFPTSNDPYLSDIPILAAAFIVQATNASSIVKCKLTQAKCITIGYRKYNIFNYISVHTIDIQYAFGLKSLPNAMAIPKYIIIIFRYILYHYRSFF